MLYSLTIFIGCVTAITLPLPVGVFTPTIAIGAGLGRAVGELMFYTFPEQGISRSGYAYVATTQIPTIPSLPFVVRWLARQMQEQ